MPTYLSALFRYSCFLRLSVATGILSLIPSISPAGTLIAGDLAPRGAANSELNVADVLILQRAVMGAITPTADENLVGDVAPWAILMGA